MKFLWDTNILLHFLRKSDKYKEIDLHYSFFSPQNQTFLSIINIAEIESLALQLNWGTEKWKSLQTFVEAVKLLDLYDETIHAYAQIDAYSQGKLANMPLPANMTARNMGKNDLWLAATAHVSNLHLVTLDADFDHLDKVFVNLIRP